ncbi:MAG TPA: hypothetical protein VIK01_05330 [Polyangiaceae bacterium]
MTKPTRNWLLDPVFPTAPSMPYLDARTRELAGLDEPGDGESSGTWPVGSHAQEEDADEPRFAVSDSEAPTVRPGTLRAAKSW